MTVTDPRGKTFSHTYDADGNLTKSVDPMGHQTTYAYISGHPGEVGSVTDPDGRSTSYGYDSAGDRTTTTDPLGHVTTTAYDADGNPTSVTNASGHTTTYGYDADNRVTQVTDALGNVTKTVYDADGNRTSVTDPEGQTTTYHYNADDEQTSTVTAAGVTTATTYDDDGNIATQVNGKGQTTSYTYDPLGRLTTTTDPLGRKTTRSYDGAGNLLTSVDPAGQTTTYTYDANNRITSIAYSDAATHNVAYVYDADGDRTSMTDGTGTTQYVYNADDRATQVTDGAGAVVVYSYDADGNRTGLTYPDGQTATYAYDDAGNVSSVTDSAGHTNSFTYNPDGTLSTTTLGNGDRIDNSYDPDGQLTATNLSQDGTQTAGLSYHRNTDELIDNQNASADLTGTDTYSYDADNRLTADTSTNNYAYDDAGDPTTNPGTGAGTQQYDAAQQLCWTSPTTQSPAPGCASPPGDATGYTYDANGNRTQAAPIGGAATHYTYDAAGRMVTATTPTAAAANGSDYTPVNPTRLVDTRTGTRTGTCTTTCATLTANGTLTFQATGLAGIPTTGVSAVQLAVTVVNPPSSGGLLVAYPAGAAAPAGRAISTIKATTTTTPVVVATSAAGQITIKSSVATDIIVDVEGYYTHTTGTQDSEFKPIDGTRILDTRTPTGTCTPSPCARLAANVTTTITIAGQGGIPATGVAAVAYTLTAFTPSADGYAVAWAADQTKPGGRDLSYTAGTTTSELLVTPVSASGQIKLASTADADYTIDLAGYYSTSPDGTGSIFIPYNPSSGTSQRILDTRTGTGDCTPAGCGTIQTGTTTTVTIAGHGSVPAATAANPASSVVLAVTAWTPSADGYAIIWDADRTKPVGRTLSYTAGTTNTGIAQVALSSQGQVKIGATTTDLSLDVEGWFQPVGTTSTYTYNGDGLRATKTSGGVTTHYTYDTTTTVPKLLTDGTTDYIYGPNGEPIEQINNSGTTDYYFSDATGSTRVLTDSTGAVDATYTYNAYGTVINHTGTNTPLQYAGGYADPETGFDYLINRYYDPATGLFTSVDPMLATTEQPYTYADNNPINETDPGGLGCALTSPWDCVGTVTSFQLRVLSSAISYSPNGLALSWISRTTGKSLGGCVGGSAFAGPGVTGSICYYATPSGQSGITLAGGGGGGGPLGANLLIGPSLSNAHTLSDFDGWFAYSSAGAGEGLYAAGTQGQVGQNSCGTPIWTATPGWAPGARVPFPYSYEGGGSYTWTFSSW